jgi:hypothetical protein
MEMMIQNERMIQSSQIENNQQQDHQILTKGNVKMKMKNQKSKSNKMNQHH